MSDILICFFNFGYTKTLVDEKPLDSVKSQINQTHARNEATQIARSAQSQPTQNGSRQPRNAGSRNQDNSNLARGRGLGLSGSTPNLSQSQITERYQRGFTTTAAERAEQLRKARGNSFY